MPEQEEDAVFGQNTAHIPGMPDPEEGNLKMNMNHLNKDYVVYLGTQGMLITDLESINAKQYRNMIQNAEGESMFQLREFSAPELAEFLIGEAFDDDIPVEELSEEEMRELVEERQAEAEEIDEDDVEEAVSEEIETEDEEE